MPEIDEGAEELRVLEERLRDYLAVVGTKALASDDWREKIPAELQDRVHSARSNSANLTPAALEEKLAQLRTALKELPIDKAQLADLYQDRLGPATRTVRRNLDATSAVSMFVACFAHDNIMQFGFTVSMTGATWAALIVLLAYHWVTFFLYGQSDKRGLRLEREVASEYERRIRGKVDGISQLASDCVKRLPDSAPGADLVPIWQGQQIAVLNRYKADLKSLRPRTWWDFALPLFVGGFAGAVVLVRALGIHNLRIRPVRDVGDRRSAGVYRFSSRWREHEWAATSGGSGFSAGRIAA